MAFTKRYTKGLKSYSIKSKSALKSAIKYSTSTSLPFFFEDRTIMDAPAILNTTKDSILTDFLQGFKNIQGDNTPPELKAMNKNQLKQLLEQWNSQSSDTIGQRLSDEMAAELHNSIVTGASLFDGLEMEESKKGNEYVRQVVKSTVENVDKGIDNIKERLATYMEILKNEQDIFLLQKIISLYKETGGTLSTDPVLQKYENMTISSADSAANVEKISKAIATLRENIGALRKAQSSKSALENLDSVMVSVRASFNEIGSEGIHEGLGAHAVNVVNNVVDNEVKKPLLKIAKDGPNWSVKATSNFASNLDEVSENKMSGLQKKDDIIIEWSNDKFTIKLPVSMKARYSAFNYNANSPRKLHGTLAPQSIALGELIDMTYQTKPRAFEQAWGAVLYKKAWRNALSEPLATEGYANLINSWNEFREAAKYTALFRALVGTGSDKGDFAALLIVNSQIFSVYDILSLSDNERIVDWDRGRNIPDFISLWKQVGGKYEKGEYPTDQSERVATEQSLIAKIYQKKYSIAIQLYNLRAALAK